MASILIAEDEERIARFIQKGLRAAGYTTTVVEDGASALDYASTGEFDLLVLDVGLPGMDGFQVLSTLRSLGFSIPVVMCTARDSVEDTVAGLVRRAAEEDHEVGLDGDRHRARGRRDPPPQPRCRRRGRDAGRPAGRGPRALAAQGPLNMKRPAGWRAFDIGAQRRP